MIMKRHNIRTLALIVVTFTYLLVGAAIFDAIESSHEVDKRKEYETMELSWREAYNMSKHDFENITELILKMKSYKAGPQWKFAGAFYFSTTLITTIGYGHSTPKTQLGKIVCMLYSAVGIPLCIVMFQSIGERMNAIITWILRLIKKIARCKNSDISQANLIIVSINIGTIVLTAGAAVFTYYEEWSYLDAFYYCFITLTTVGFGDMVALQKDETLKSRPDYVAFSLLFIMIGLTVVSSAMNLLVLRFLTMNTEDVRRAELEEAAAAKTAVRLEGDVIQANGSLQQQSAVDETQETNLLNSTNDPYTSDTASLCSCTCYGRPSSQNNLPFIPQLLRNRRFYQRYTVKRKPGAIRHLLRNNSSIRLTNLVTSSSLHQQDSGDSKRLHTSNNATAANNNSATNKRYSL